jgi:hypothetical protein
MLALVVAVELGLKAREDRLFASYLRDCWRFAGRAAGGEAARSEVLCFGDSLVKFGLSPRDLQAEAGLPAYNLAAYGGPPALSLHALDRALDAGAKPKALILAFAHANLSYPLGFYGANWSLMSSPLEGIDLARNAHDPSLFAWVMLGRAVPSVRRRFEIRQRVRSAFLGTGETDGWAQSLQAHRAEWRRNRGGELLDRPPFRVAFDPSDRSLFPTAWSWNPAQKSYFARFLDRAAARGVPVFYLLPPVSPTVHTAYEKLGVNTWQEGLAWGVQARWPGVTVVDARYSAYPEDAFFDTAHLNARGASQLSRDLGRVLRDHLGDGTAATRWVRLPPYAGAQAAGNDPGQGVAAIGDRRPGA